MAATGEFVAHGFGHAILNAHVASAQRLFDEARGCERSLNIHAVIDYVRDELSLRLRLVGAAHDTESDFLLAFLHERGNDGVIRALARSKRVRMLGVRRKCAGAVVQMETEIVDHHARSPKVRKALDPGSDVAF